MVRLVSNRILVKLVYRLKSYCINSSCLSSSCHSGDTSVAPNHGGSCTIWAARSGARSFLVGAEAPGGPGH